MIPVWPKVKLKSLYHGLYDGPHATPKESEEGAVFLGIKNVTEDGRLDLSEIRHIAEDDLAKWTKRVTPSKDDIVFSYEATLHRYARIPEGFRGCLGRRMALIRPDTSQVDINYLFSYFLSPLWRAEVEKHILSGATVDRIPLTNVPEFELFLPPLQIQKKISAILSSYDDLIENNLKRIKLLEEMAQITYEEWFVFLKFSGHEKAIFDEETGLPEGWYSGSVTDICQVNKDTVTAKNAPDKIKYIDIASAYTGGYESPEELKFAEAPSRARRRVKFGDTIFSTVRPNRKTYSIILDDETNLVASTGFAALRPKIENTFSFVYLTVANQDFVDGAVSVAGGAAYPAVKQSDFEKIKITVPSSNVIRDFSSKVNSHFEAISSLKKQNILLTEARDILLPRLMTGMIDIEQVELPEAILLRIEQQEAEMAEA